MKKIDTKYTLLFQHIKAPNDINGNPRRLFLLYDGSIVLDAITEGYKGYSAIDYAGYDRNTFSELPSIFVTASEYKTLLKTFAKKEEKS